MVLWMVSMLPRSAADLKKCISVLIGLVVSWSAMMLMNGFVMGVLWSEIECHRIDGDEGGLGKKLGGKMDIMHDED